MRNGNIAFGNEKGDVILFEPSTSEHISARTIHDPITALAPSSDCKTYALGYRNGSILLAALQPQFTILHTLNTTRSPSPISMLTWHASSSKQKSDMLAIQNADGDLRVWSVPKPPTNGIPRVIRILKRSETAISGGRNWVSWSKNGRIIQFSEGGTWAWDVRTKDVNYVPIPTVEFVDGIAAHGPTASLFTLGMDSTVQQYDVESGNMVANIRHLPLSIPPTPPEEHVRQFNSVSQQEARSPLRTSRNDNESNDSPISQSQAAGLRKLEKTTSVNDITSPVKTERSATTFSMGTYNYGQTQPRALQQQQQPISPVTGPSRDRVRQASRLRQEVLMSPMPSAAAAAAAEEAPQLIDLFPFARLRLSDTLSSSLKAPDENNSTPDDLRKHMLNVVFGWEDDIYALIADELQRHPDDSLNALYLTKWLHHGSEAFAELLANTTPDTSLDTLRLALGVIDSRPENKKLGQIFVEKALGNGDIHTAVAVLIAMGDKNDAIEVYVTNNCYLESILLTCLMMPGDWQRQSHLVRRWGEHVVENSQQQLAIRCFACTGVEPADDWTSPTARLFNKFASPISATMSQPAVMFPRAPPAADYEQYQQSPAYSAPPAIQNPSVSRLKGRGFDSMTPVALVAPPSPFRQAAASGTRITPQTGGLKLITSFGPTTKSFKFPGLKTPDMTPTNTNTTMVTPIAESATTRSALSPGGLGSYRMNNIQSLNNAMAMSYPMSAGPGRQRLPSIGETPQDVDTPRFPQSRGIARAPPTPADSGSDREKERVAAARAADTAQQSQRSERSEPALTLLTSARYDPSSTPIPKYESDPEPQTALRPRDDNNSWHASANQGQEEFNPTETYDIPSRPGTTDTTGTQFVMSTPDPNDSWRVKSPSVSARSVDQYISSLEQAQYYGRTHSSNSNRPRKEERSDRNKSRSRKHKNSEVTGPKRSPSSPVPMSPDDLRHFTTSVESFDSMLYSSANTSATDQPGFSSSYDQRGSNAEMGRTRHRSRSTHTGMRRKHSLKGSRRSSPGPEADVSRRGRSQSRKAGSVARSPSSPMPMLPSDEDMERVGSVDPAFRFVSQNRSRLQRSTSRRPERGTSARRDASPDRRRGRQRSPSRQRDAETPVASKINGFGSNDSRHRKRDASEDPHRRERSQYESLEQLDQMAEMIRKNDVSGQRMTSKSKELAQAELEARRLSLARNPSAPPIPFPSSHSKSASDGIYPPHAAMQRNHSDLAIRTLPRGSSRLGYEDPQERPATSQGMQDHEESARPSHQSQKESLSNLSYQLLPARTYSANKNPNQTDSWTPEDPPSHMPRHPGFDHRIGTSRRSSRSRTRAASQDGRRGVSTERSKQFVESKVVPEEESLTEEPPAVIIGSPEFPYEGSESRESTGPTIIPELQHLAVPPPPPPPPPPPHPEPTTSFNQGGPLRIETDLAQGIDTPLPRSVYPGASDLPTGSEKQHRRQSSRDGSSQGQFLGKIRGITDRIRSSSRPRDNYTRSPNFDDYPTSPYETAHTMPTLLSVAGGGERR